MTRKISRSKLRKEAKSEHKAPKPRRVNRQDLRKKFSEPVFTYKQNGSYYTVYKHGEKVDKFQGKAGLEKYGLKDAD